MYLHAASKELWRARENRVLYALGNCLLNAKVSHHVVLLVIYGVVCSEQ